MFTGIIQEIGKVKNITRRGTNITLQIEAARSTRRLRKGWSIAVNGVCQTVTSIKNNSFFTDVTPETQRKTNLSLLEKNSKVNLELPLTLKDLLSGHFVTGHVDATGLIMNKEKIQGGPGLRIQFPKKLSRFFALKGSVTINGVSLTIAHLYRDSFSIALIPFTQKNTNLGELCKDDKVNIEIDLLIRYLYRLSLKQNKILSL